MFEEIPAVIYDIYVALGVGVLIAAAIVCWMKRKTSPRTAWLLLAALGLRLVRAAMDFAESYVFFELPISFNDGWAGLPDLSDPGAFIYLAWEIATAALNLASWSLIAWAILSRPDEGRQRQAA